MDDTTKLRFEIAENPFATPIGFDLRSDYVRDCYAPILGPSSVLLAGRLAQLLHDGGGPVEVNARELGWSLGIKATGSRSPLARTFRRLAQHKVLVVRAEDSWSVFGALPPLSERLVNRKLPPWSTQRHRELLGRALDELQAQRASPGRGFNDWPIGRTHAGLGGRGL